MTSKREEQFRKLLETRTEYAVSAAFTYLLLADPCSESANSIFTYPLDDWDHKATEAAHIGLMQLSGVSWDVLAGHYNTSRQALHKRLANRVDEVQSEEIFRSNPYVDLRRKLETIIDLAMHLVNELDSETERFAQTWDRRSRSRGWWRREYSGADDN